MGDGKKKPNPYHPLREIFFEHIIKAFIDNGIMSSNSKAELSTLISPNGRTKTNSDVLNNLKNGGRFVKNVM
ncbi:MAG: hypothetical protein ACQERB_05040 [Promethearchaeati archaeon]